MDIARFGENFPGEIRSDEGYPTYKPDPLPPDIEFSNDLITKLGQARGAVGKLSGIGQMVHESRMLLLGPFVRREAVYSSRIEGTYATVSEVYAHEAGQSDAIDSKRSHEISEVFNYVAATQQGLDVIGTTNLTVQLIKDLHKVLMEGVRGGDKNPGEFRTEQNAIGHNNPLEARFVPPSPQSVPYEVEQLVEFIETGSDYDPLIDIAITHYQFETIHPFSDGNGRIGRLLITLMLDKYGLLPDPFLYFSSYFNAHRDEYVDSLFRVHSHGKWEEWISFFLAGVIDQSKEVFMRSKRLLELREEYRQRYQHRRSETILSVIYELFKNPVTTINRAAERTDSRYAPTRNAILELEEDEVLKEVTGKQRYKVYHASEIIDLIEQPIENLVDNVDEEFEKYQTFSDLTGDQAELGDFN